MKINVGLRNRAQRRVLTANLNATARVRKVFQGGMPICLFRLWSHVTYRQYVVDHSSSTGSRLLILLVPQSRFGDNLLGI